MWLKIRTCKYIIVSVEHFFHDFLSLKRTIKIFGPLVMGDFDDKRVIMPPIFPSNSEAFYNIFFEDMFPR